MDIKELQKQYARSAQVAQLAKAVEKSRVKSVYLEGLQASAAALVFSALALKTQRTLLFVLQHADEAGYFYHDLCQIMGDRQSTDGQGAVTERVLFFPSSYRRAIKYGQKDPASEILRTEVLTRMMPGVGGTLIVTYPEALAEQVVTRRTLDRRMLTLEQGQTVSVEQTLEQLRDLGFREVDYVYEPGQFALRGSILDVFSFSHEYPFRIDFFGDDVDSIRTFEVENQLSKERRQRVDIVPELTSDDNGLTVKESLLNFLPDDTLLVFTPTSSPGHSLPATWPPSGASSSATVPPRHPTSPLVSTSHRSQSSTRTSSYWPPPSRTTS